MSEIQTLATLVLGGAFDATELGENDIQPDSKLIEELQQRLVMGTDDVYIQLIDRAELDRVTAERDALQQRLNAADQRIDELTPRLSEHLEGKRERFQKWVMATKHPVFGFLDGRSLARGDDRTGYADEYVQGLWVAYLAFGAFASRDDSIAWLKRIDGIGQNRAELIYSMGFRRLAD